MRERESEGGEREDECTCIQLRSKRTFCVITDVLGPEFFEVIVSSEYICCFAGGCSSSELSELTMCALFLVESEVILCSESECGGEIK